MKNGQKRKTRNKRKKGKITLEEHSFVYSISTLDSTQIVEL